MADYWKSGERHFCTFCKCWLAGNKISIELHERGNHHKNSVRTKLEQLRKSSVEKEREEKQFNTTLGQIERAANESFRRDLAAETSNYTRTNNGTPAEINLPSKLKRPANEPVQIQCKKPKFILKTPSQRPIYKPIESSQTEETEVNTQTSTKSELTNDESQGIWYESKTETGDSYYWNDTTGESTWTPPTVYLSIEEQRSRGLKV